MLDTRDAFLHIRMTHEWRSYFVGIEKMFAPKELPRSLESGNRCSMAQIKNTERELHGADYRTRLYELYVTTQLKADSDQLRALLNAGSPYQETLVRKFFPADRSISILDIGRGH